MSNTYDAILSRLRQGLQSDVSTMEGTWTGNNLQTVADEIARLYAQDIEPMYKKAFVQLAEGDDLDHACADYGVERNAATAAEGTVTVTGIMGIYSGVVVAADDILFTVLEDVVIPASGAVDVRVRCTVSGAAGNVPAGAVNGFGQLLPGLESAYNNAPITGGYDTESDASLRSRTLAKIRTPSTSGNIAQYKEWALDVSGVESAQVFDLARGAGTVDVVVTADGNSVPSTALLEAVSSFIESCRPIGADVQVSAAERSELTVAAVIVATAGYTADTIRTAFYNILSEYLRTLPIGGSRVSYIKMADLLFRCEGVEDVISYTVNGGTESVVPGIRCFPAAGLPVITIQEE